jgi:hypothetical protein
VGEKKKARAPHLRLCERESEENKKERKREKEKERV